MIKELADCRELIESICVVDVTDNILSLSGDICYYFVPCGFVNSEFYKDTYYNTGEYVSMSKYISPATYYTYTKPITFDLFKAKIHLHDEVAEILKNHISDIYEIDVILGGMLKDMNINGRFYYSWECTKMERKDLYHVQITIPPTIPVNKENICICSCYEPNKVYYITGE